MRKLVLILTVAASFGPMASVAAAGGPDPKDPLNTCWGFKHTQCDLGDIVFP